MFTSTIENFLFNTATMALRPKKHSTLEGGANLQIPEGFGSNFILTLIIIAVFFIKVLIVMISYNIIVPRLLDSYGQDMSRFRPINFIESIFLVLLFNNLFSKF